MVLETKKHEEPMFMSQSKTVCVIGAGPSGLVSARELKREGHKVVVMEQNGDVGGQWLYQPNVEEEDPLGKTKILKVHSSIYSSLRLISPREIMGFSDFPFTAKEGRDTRRFPGHEELWLYLKDFCEVFGLREMIRFNVRVEFVGMVNDDNDDDNLKRWRVKSVEKKSGEVIEEVFDAVVVAAGHYTYPRLPSIKGMDLWKGKQVHSHVYRVPDPFRDEVVVVVGGSISGPDISIELVKVAKEVHLSVKSLDVSPGVSKAITKHQSLHLQPQIESLEEDGRVIFVDGSCIVADTILYCTGYWYKFPFLESEGIRVEVDDNRVGPLFEHTFPPSLSPSLSFVGIPRKLIGLPFFESQAKWIARLLSGKTSLPSYDEMMQSVAEFYRAREANGVPKRNTHDIGRDFVNYCDKYADYTGYPHLEEWRKKLCVTTILRSLDNLETSRDSWDDDYELLQETLQDPYFAQRTTP